MLAGIGSLPPRQSAQTELLIQRHPPLSGSERDPRRRDRFQWALAFEMGLEQAKPIKGTLSGLFRDSRQLVHTRRVRQIACKLLRHIICKVTAMGFILINAVIGMLRS